jgi:hypothetical protein
MPGITLGRSIRAKHLLQCSTGFGELGRVVVRWVPCIAIPQAWAGAQHSQSPIKAPGRSGDKTILRLRVCGKRLNLNCDTSRAASGGNEFDLVDPSRPFMPAIIPP